MRNSSSIQHVAALKESVRKFALCSHHPHVMDGLTPKICAQCSIHVDTSAKQTENIVPSASRLCFSLVDYSIERSTVQVRKLAAAAADVLDIAVLTRENFSLDFVTTNRMTLSRTMTITS